MSGVPPARCCDAVAFAFLWTTRLPVRSCVWTRAVGRGARATSCPSTHCGCGRCLHRSRSTSSSLAGAGAARDPLHDRRAGDRRRCRRRRGAVRPLTTAMMTGQSTSSTRRSSGWPFDVGGHRRVGFQVVVDGLCGVSEGGSSASLASTTSTRTRQLLPDRHPRPRRRGDDRPYPRDARRRAGPGRPQRRRPSPCRSPRLSGAGGTRGRAASPTSGGGGRTGAGRVVPAPPAWLWPRRRRQPTPRSPADGTR